MSDAAFRKVFEALCRHPRAIALSILAVTALAGLGICFVPFEGSLEIMLPSGSEARRTVIFLRDANFADKVAISVAIDEAIPGSAEAAATAHGLTDLTEAMDSLAATLRASPLVKQALTFPNGNAMMSQMVTLLDHAPELLGADELRELDAKLTEENVDRSIRRCYLALLKPEGSFLQEALRRDPLGIASPVLQRLRRTPEAFGYQVMVQNGHLIHPDEKHGLLVLETGIPITDSVGARALVELVQGACGSLPRGFSATVTCGHLHSVANERMLRRDIRLIGILASVAFPLLFLIMFRDARSILIFLLPAASIVVALILTALAWGRLSYMIIGFGAVLAGVADYGTHVYVALQYGKERFMAIRRIAGPIVLGALTVAAVFVAFFFSTIEGYRQLAVFATISIALSVICSLFFLPPFLKVGRRNSGRNGSGGAGRVGEAMPGMGMHGRGGATLARGAGLFFLLALAAAVVPAGRVRLESSLTQLDGAGADILRAEAEFQELWSGGQGTKAIAVVEAASYGEAARLNDMLHEKVQASLPGDDFISMSTFWPSAAARAENLRRWRESWTPERVATLRARIQKAAASHGFAEDAFAPFLQLVSGEARLAADAGAGRGAVVEMPLDSALLMQLHGRFVQETSAGYRFMSFLPDTPAAREAVRRALADIPGAFVVSRQGLAGALSESIGREVLRTSVIGFILVLVVTFALMRNIRLALAALLPPATSVLWMFAIMHLFGVPINIANMMAGIVVFGLCMEYGIFMAHSFEEGEELARPARHAMTLSAGTTLLGAAVLLFAQHPALFSIGTTLVIGISAGYVAALLGVPGICLFLKIQPRVKAEMLG